MMKMTGLRFAARLLGVLALGGGLLAPLRLVAQTPGVGPDPLRVAIESAVVEHMGRGAVVTVEAVTPAWSGAFTRVSIDPGARLGSPVSITIFTGPATSVRVRAELRVVADYAVASRPVAAGQTLTAGELTAVHGAVGGVPLRRLPTIGALIGARALRPMAVGDIVEPGFVAVVPLVRAGQPVTAIARIGAVEASSVFVAVDNGGLDDIIRIVNPDTRRTLRACVVSSGLVEVIDVQ